MVIPQYTDTHPPIGGDFLKLGDVNVIKILHPHRFLVRPVVALFPDLYRNVALLQLPYHLIAEHTALVPPEPDACLQFLPVPVTGMLRKGGKKNSMNDSRYALQEDGHLVCPWHRYSHKGRKNSPR